ncbi:hypothetical protein TNCV_1562981 [Trichonephila clavipes]|nr:hypothetical protein TNCV_1562981 [Trichonephila clavipes]
MRFCNISAYSSPVTVAVTKPESRISSKKKRPNNGRCGKSNPYRDFLVVQWSFRDSSRIFSSPNSAVVDVDRPLEQEISFVCPQEVTQPIVIFCNAHTANALRFTESPGNNS